MMNTYVSFIGAGIVILAISSICHLFLLVIHDNYIFPPTRWTVKVFIAALFILSILSICVTWICTKTIFRQQQQKSKMKILVIDDWRSTAELIGKYFPEATVDHMYGLPVVEEDFAKLDEYDILFVDNEGIGNKQYRDGQEFLKAYQPESDKQMIIYHSGLSPEPDFKKILDDKGFFSFTKGNNPDKLVQLVTENFKGDTQNAN